MTFITQLAAVDAAADAVADAATGGGLNTMAVDAALHSPETSKSTIPITALCSCL
jgi:uncharacterized membrane protein